jgi:hypothetical protein
VESARFLKKSRLAPSKINADLFCPDFRLAFCRLALPKNFLSILDRAAPISAMAVI